MSKYLHFQDENWKFRNKIGQFRIKSPHFRMKIEDVRQNRTILNKKSAFQNENRDFWDEIGQFGIKSSHFTMKIEIFETKSDNFELQMQSARALFSLKNHFWIKITHFKKLTLADLRGRYSVRTIPIKWWIREMERIIYLNWSVLEFVRCVFLRL